MEGGRDLRWRIFDEIDAKFKLSEEPVDGKSLCLHETREFSDQIFPGSLFAVDAFEPGEEEEGFKLSGFQSVCTGFVSDFKEFVVVPASGSEEEIDFNDV